MAFLTWNQINNRLAIATDEKTGCVYQLQMIQYDASTASWSFGVRHAEHFASVLAWGFESIDEAKAHAEEYMQHLIDGAVLEREHIPLAVGPFPPHTPWGVSPNPVQYAEGIIHHECGGHGGFQLKPEQNAMVPDAVRCGDTFNGGFYEEDVKWAIVARVFPEIFTPYERKRADQIMKSSIPEVYEHLSGEVIAEGNGSLWARKLKAENKGAWFCFSASTHDDDTMALSCSVDGKRDSDVEVRTFLVPKRNYDMSMLGGLINPSHYPELTPEETPIQRL